ncbi:MAG: hypothetical protein QOF12_1052, partial [Solirubrobacteraceae bacterium]|nr:hypothetical protein [Solirubrobacteraceae bacterium]
VWGARALVQVERAWMTHVLGAWDAGVSSLREARTERTAAAA